MLPLRARAHARGPRAPSVLRAPSRLHGDFGACGVQSRSHRRRALGRFDRRSRAAAVGPYGGTPRGSTLRHGRRPWVANQDITAELALDLSVAAAHVLAEVGAFNGHRPVAVVGRDPRASGEFLAAAAWPASRSAGVDVRDAGVLPTPAIAYLMAEQDADLGVMLSASHNPMPDNGIKFFARGGHKLADEVEDRIEARLRDELGAPHRRRRRPHHATAPTAPTATSPTCCRRCPNRLDGLHVVIDGAHGAASRRSRPRRSAQAGARGHRDRRRARRPQHQRRLRLDPPGPPQGGRGRSRRRPRHRPRRRRRPVPRGRRHGQRGRRRPDHGDPRRSP